MLFFDFRLGHAEDFLMGVDGNGWELMGMMGVDGNDGNDGHADD